MIYKPSPAYLLALDQIKDDPELLCNTKFRLLYWPLLHEHIVESRKIRETSVCEWCRQPISNGFNPELHHGILTKADSSRASWKGREDVEENLFMLHPSCHRPKPPNRERCWYLSCKRYGVERVKQWYLSIPYKLGKPPRLFWEN